MHSLATLLLLPLAIAHNPLQPRRHHARLPRPFQPTPAPAPTPHPVAIRQHNDSAEAADAAAQAYSQSMLAAAGAVHHQGGGPPVGPSPTGAIVDSDALSATASTAVTSAVAVAASSSAGASASAAVASSADASSAVQSQAVSAVGSAQVASSTGLSDAYPSPTPVASSAASSADPINASPSANLPSTLSVAPSASVAALVASTATPLTVNVVTTVSRSSSILTSVASSSASAAAANSGSKTGGLATTTLVAIIVVSVVVALAIAGWCGFRKWKLRPSRRFDEKMRPIDFSPYADVGLEKTHHRSLSGSSAALQRRDLVDELEKAPYVPGIPDHDFTAGPGMAGHGAGPTGHGYDYDADTYNHDPFAHAEAYEYDPMGDYSQHGVAVGQPQYVDPEYGYQNQGQHYLYEGRYTDHPTQDTNSAEGYADLHRSHSIGSGGHDGGSASGHGHGQPIVQPHRYSGGAEQFPMEGTGFPVAEQYLGRPTGGADGPYAQAATYRY